MAVFATGLTKFLLASSATGNKNATHKPETTERGFRQDKDAMCPIIKGQHTYLPTRRFRMAQLELFSLQSGAGARHTVEPALLALPDAAPRKISQRTPRTYGKRSPALVCRSRSLARGA